MKQFSNKLSVGRSIHFDYKRGKVSGIIKSLDEKYCTIELTSPYHGKNEYWSIGELKVCSIKEMK